MAITPNPLDRNEKKFALVGELFRIANIAQYALFFQEKMSLKEMQTEMERIKEIAVKYKQAKNPKTPHPSIRFAEWLSENEWVKRKHGTHPNKIGQYYSHKHCEYKTIEELFKQFTENK